MLHDNSAITKSVERDLHRCSGDFIIALDSSGSGEVIDQELDVTVFAVPLRQQACHLHLVDLLALHRFYVGDVPRVRPLPRYPEQPPVSVLEEFLESDVRLSGSYLACGVAQHLDFSGFARDPEQGLLDREQILRNHLFDVRLPYHLVGVPGLPPDGILYQQALRRCLEGALKSARTPLHLSGTPPTGPLRQRSSAPGTW